MMESEERKERKKRAEILIVQSKVKRLDQQEVSELRDYVLEFLDEIVVELAIVFSILKIIGMTIREAVKIKMPEWIAKKYMRGIKCRCKYRPQNRYKLSLLKWLNLKQKKATGGKQKKSLITYV